MEIIFLIYLAAILGLPLVLLMAFVLIVTSMIDLICKK